MDPVNGKYELCPYPEYFDSLECVLPADDKQIWISWNGKELRFGEKQ